MEPKIKKSFLGEYEGGAIVVAGGIFLLLTIAVFIFLLIYNTSQRAIVKRLQEKIGSVDAELQKLEQTNQIAQILYGFQTLYPQTERTGIAKLLGVIEKSIPQKVKLTSISRGEEGRVNLAGKAISKEDVALFAQALSEQSSISNVQINSISRDQAGISYTITFNTSLY